MLTGSGSKGRKYRYYYYHCTSACGVRYRADFVNREFERELKKHVPHQAATELYKTVILEAWNIQVKDEKQQTKVLITQISELNTRVTKGRELLLANDIDAVDFKTIKTEAEKQISSREAKLTEAAAGREDITPTLSKAVDNLSHLDETYQTATTIKKRQIVGSIFPEKLTFEGEIFRTIRLNEAVKLIYTLDVAFRETKNGTSGLETNLSHLMNPLGLEPRTPGFGVMRPAVLPGRG